MKLTTEQLQRYSRHFILPEIGQEGQVKLLQSKVLLIGTGGLGSPLGLYLAAAGVGTLGLVDFDDVDLSLVQIICAAHRSAISNNKVLLLQDKLPDAFVQIIDDAGLNGHIGCSTDDRGCCVWQNR